MTEQAVFYSYLITGLLVAWIIPILTVWVRYDRYPHRKYMLLATFVWPLTLVDEWLRAFGGADDWLFAAGLFQFVPVLICTWLMLATHQLLFEKKLSNVWRYYIPTFIMFLGQLPFVLTNSADKLTMFLAQPSGDLLMNWPLYLPAMFAGFVMLALTVQTLEWVSNYHEYLSEQVVDVNFYRFKGLSNSFIGTMLAAFVAIIATTLAAFGLGMEFIWLSLINLLFAGCLFMNLLILLARRRYSPSPIEAEDIEGKKFSDAYLRDTLRKAEQAIIKQKAYKHIGLRIRQLADVAEVDPVALAVATRTILNRNFRAFIYHYRLEYAKKILMQTDAKVSSVARRLGFNSEKFLSDVFVKYIQVMGRDHHHEDEDKLFR